MSTIPADNPFNIPSLNFKKTPSLYWWDPKPVGNNYGQIFVGNIYSCYTRKTSVASSPELCLATADNTNIRWGFGTVNSPSELVANQNLSWLSSFTYNGQTVYYTFISSSASWDNIDTNTLLNSNVVIRENQYPQLAWLMVFGGYDGFNVTYSLVHCTGADDNPTIIPPETGMNQASFTPDEGFNFTKTSCSIEGTGPHGRPVGFSWSTSGALVIGQVTSDIVVHVTAVQDPYTPGGTSGPGGGGMSGDAPPHDTIDFPNNPSISATKAGFVSIWTPTEGQVEKLAAYLWTTDILTGAFWKKIIQNPLDLIFGLQIMPVPIYHTEGETEPRREDEYLAMKDNVVLGWTNTRIKMDYIPEQFVEIDCGEVDMEEYWKAYLDYAPYTKIDIYLPYIGVKTLNTNDCMSRTIHLKYKIDLASGSCVAIIKCDDSVYYHFSGNCASAVPLTAVQMQEVIRNAMTTAVAAGAGALAASAGASPLAVAASKAAVAASAARTVMSGPEYHRSGSNASTTGLMSVQTPYLIITRPRQAIPEKQNTYTGYPSFITEQIGELSGYTEVEIIHMHDLTCTSEEFTEIEDLLLKGVII